MAKKSIEKFNKKVRDWYFSGKKTAEKYFYDELVPDLELAKEASKGDFKYFPLLVIDLTCNSPDDRLREDTIDQMIEYIDYAIPIAENWDVNFKESVKKEKFLSLLNNKAFLLNINLRYTEAKEVARKALDFLPMIPVSRTSIRIAIDSADNTFFKYVLSVIKKNSNLELRMAEYSKFRNEIEEIDRTFFSKL